MLASKARCFFRRVPLTWCILSWFLPATVQPVQGLEDSVHPLIWKVESKSKSKLVGTKPFTLKVVEDDDLRKLLTSLSEDKGSKLTLRLNLVVGTPAVRLVEPHYGIKVFVNSSEEDPTPGVDSPHYVGMVAPFEKKEKDNYAVDLAPPLRKLILRKQWAPDNALTITLALVSMNPKKPIPNDLEIPIEHIALEAPKVTK